jgi:hypothetical protein
VVQVARLPPPDQQAMLRRYSGTASRTCSTLLARTESVHTSRQSMVTYNCNNVEIFIKHLKNAEKDPSLSEAIQKDAQSLIEFFTHKISASKQDPHFSALNLVSFDLPFPKEMEKAIHVSDDEYGKVVEFLRARPLASRGS